MNHKVRECEEEKMQQRHAYLILAHNEFYVLETLLTLLDNEQNDIYVHIDKKVKNIPFESLNRAVKRSKLYFVERQKVQWGGDSLITCELRLLGEATKRKYAYYHMLSGVDLPIKTQEEIHQFFEENQGKEYLSFDSEAMATGSFLYRIQYWYFFQNVVGRNRRWRDKMLRLVQRMLICIQKLLLVNRYQHANVTFYKGANWFSITHDLAIHVLNQKRFIRKYCYRGLMADEIFLQTIAMNSPFRNSIVNSDLRYIDWNRGKPYTITNEDFEDLISSDRLWARKFSAVANQEIIDRIAKYLECER